MQPKKLLLFYFLFIQLSLTAQSLVVGTFNLRYDNPRDTGNLWVNRAPMVSALIRFHEFDIVGTQEGLINQLEDMQAALPGYTWYGMGRDDGERKGEFSAIFYKKDKFRELKKGSFWLSPTPEKPGPGWDARLNRICSWLQLQETGSKKSFYVFNVHYDHQGVQARKESSKLLLEKIKSIAGNAPVILTGDFNGSPESEWYQTLANSELLTDTYQMVKSPYALSGSTNGFGATVQRSGIIDHLFVTKHWKAGKWGILTDSFRGKYPSDHFPVLVTIGL